MARKPRIEYAGAVYHIMNRGDKGQRVFRDKQDYEIFLAMMAEVCKRSGWRIHSYILMPNHFHWLVETLEPNLVAGMKWFLGAYSQKFNCRHGQRGHVFQGRYKALVIDPESGGYFGIVSTYIHLNPARAQLLEPDGKELRGYSWSSYPLFLVAESKRPLWLEVDRVFGNLDIKDDTGGRKAYEDYMEGRRAELRKLSGRKAFQRDCKAIRHGWYLGGESFGERLIGKLTDVVEDKDRASYSGEGIKRHDEQEAERVLCQGMKILQITEQDLMELPKGHNLKKLLAWRVHSQTMASHKWISSRLNMGCLSNLSMYIRSIEEGSDKEIIAGRKRLEKAAH